MILIDRIEGEYAVLEIAGKHVPVPSSVLPEGAREGDRLEFRRVENSAGIADAAAVLERLKKRTPQGPETIDL